MFLTLAGSVTRAFRVLYVLLGLFGPGVGKETPDADEHEDEEAPQQNRFV